MAIQIELGGTSPQKKADTPAPQGPVLGIDLGTTNSLVSVVQSGKARVLFNAGEGPLLPSVVSLNENGSVKFVGDEAVSERALRPEHVLFSVKRLMGRSLKDLQSDIAQIPYALEDDELGAQARIRVGTTRISPVEVSAEILRALKIRAEKALGEVSNRAVVTVPAYFDDAQRSATKAAGRLAGLHVLRVINEPTAAALAYGWSNENPGTVAIFDLGGGTFDISLLRIEPNTYQVLSTAGDTHLGGDDLDRALAEKILSKIPAAHPLRKLSLGSRQAHLLVAAEAAKKTLSIATSALISIEGFELSVTRDEAEALWRPILLRAIECCQSALRDARLSVAQIQDVLLVGGSTRVPLVKKLVEEFFGRTANDSLNPDEVVSLGAALQGEILSGRGEERLLMDVVPLSLGLETMGGAVTKLIHRNSGLPVEAREVFTNHSPEQNAFDLHIVQGERELAGDCRSLARFKLRGLAAAPAGFHRIEVLFRIDSNGILNVRAKDLRSGVQQEIEVRPSFGITEDELIQMLESAYEHAEDDMSKRQLVDLKIEASTVIVAAENILKDSGHKVEAATAAEFKARLVDLRNAYNSNSWKQLRDALDTLEECGKELAEIQVNGAISGALKNKDASKV
ncbi:MAG: Fe-S protein assembly chaperone HscA [Bdellovibrionota bacterium]